MNKESSPFTSEYNFQFSIKSEKGVYEITINAHTAQDTILTSATEQNEIILFEAKDNIEKREVLRIRGTQEKPSLSNTQYKLLNMLAKGYSLGQIAKERNRSESTIKNLLSAMYEKFHIMKGDKWVVVKTAIELNMLDLNDLKNYYIEHENLKEVDLNILSKREKELLDFFTVERSISANKDLALKFGLSESTIKNHFLNIANKMDTDNRIKIGMKYIFAKKDKNG